MLKRDIGFVLLALGMLGCTVGEGHGEVKSDALFIEECWNGAFSLDPDFFGAYPYREETLLIRVQRGDNIEHVSDGLTVLVNDLQDLRKRLNEPLQVGLPPGVSPPGVPIEKNPNPPPVSLALYLHNTCHLENSTIYSVSGTITFSSLFSGDINESSSEKRYTSATFEAKFADPRELVKSDAADPASAKLTSTVTGNFAFFFQRGQPAQPFQ
jgi:hypothetical protein